MTYKVKLHFFEGPLDLLLFLIDKERIDIYDIPINKITEQYLTYLEMMNLLDLEVAGEFLVMAATLIHIKSKMLLPAEVVPEEAAEGDPREELVKRLLEYKRYKEAAGDLLTMKENRSGYFLRQGSDEPQKKYIVDDKEYFEASLFDLITAFKKVLTDAPKDAFHQVLKDRFTVSEKIHIIYHRLREQNVIFFSALFSETKTKDEIIATFLAVLELLKMREIIVVQKEYFGEIEIIRNPELSAHVEKPASADAGAETEKAKEGNA
ncbi:MAG: segregation/condensation protein A [Candidatus Omnitrophica bacterium]|nr:segregation/condensation protein A [Candidatus Omnitrophota bacterium]